MKGTRLTAEEREQLLRLLSELQWRPTVQWQGVAVAYQQCPACGGAKVVKGHLPDLLHEGHQPCCRIERWMKRLEGKR